MIERRPWAYCLQMHHRNRKTNYCNSKKNPCLESQVTHENKKNHCNIQYTRGVNQSQGKITLSAKRQRVFLGPSGPALLSCSKCPSSREEHCSRDRDRDRDRGGIKDRVGPTVATLPAWAWECGGIPWAMRGGWDPRVSGQEVKFEFVSETRWGGGWVGLGACPQPVYPKPISQSASKKRYHQGGGATSARCQRCFHSAGFGFGIIWVQEEQRMSSSVPSVARQILKRLPRRYNGLLRCLRLPRVGPGATRPPQTLADGGIVTPRHMPMPMHTHTHTRLYAKQSVEYLLSPARSGSHRTSRNAPVSQTRRQWCTVRDILHKVRAELLDTAQQTRRGGGGLSPPFQVFHWGRVGTACAHDREKLGVFATMAIFLPIQTIVHPHNVGQPQNAIRIVFILTAEKVWRRGHCRNHSVRQRGQAISSTGKGPIQIQILDRYHGPLGKDAQQHTPIH